MQKGTTFTTYLVPPVLPCNLAIGYSKPCFRYGTVTYQTLKLY